MLAAVRAGAPRSTVYVGSSLAAAGAFGVDSFGTGLLVPLAGSEACASGRGLATGFFASGAFSAGFGVGVGDDFWAAGAPLPDGLFFSGCFAGAGACDTAEPPPEPAAVAGAVGQAVLLEVG